MKKKAEVSETTVLLIIILLTSVLLFQLIQVTVSSAGEDSERLSCRLSAVISGLGGEGLTGVINPFELYCPRQVILVRQSKMIKQLQHIVPELKGKTREYIYQTMSGQSGEQTPKTTKKILWGKETTTAEIEALIAYEMAECWKTFYEGENKFIRGSPYWDQDVCFICSEIVFLDEPEEELTLNMQAYLENTQTHIPGHRENTVKDYLYNSKPFPDSNTCKQEFSKGYYGSDSTEPIPLTVKQGSSVLVMLYKHEQFGLGKSCLSTQYLSSTTFPRMCDILIN